MKLLNVLSLAALATVGFAAALLPKGAQFFPFASDTVTDRHQMSPASLNAVRRASDSVLSSVGAFSTAASTRFVASPRSMREHEVTSVGTPRTRYLPANQVPGPRCMPYSHVALFTRTSLTFDSAPDATQSAARLLAS
jgi:hypothetical protein